MNTTVPDRVTSENYVGLVLLTESNDYDVIRKRLKDNPSWVKELLTDLIAMGDLCRKLDTHKKFMFYGKTKVVEESKIPSLDFNDNDVMEVIMSGLSDERVIRLLHSALGSYTEDEEFVTPILLKILLGEEIDYVNLAGELGDKFWYIGLAIAVLYEIAGFTMDAVLKANIVKLVQKRYKGKYTEEASLNRDLVGERKVLEESLGTASDA